MLYPYQQTILQRLRDAWRRTDAVMIQMPTGTGKTHVLAAVTRDFLAAGGGAVWIVAHRRELVAQVEETLARYAVRDGVRALSVQWLARHLDEMTETPALIIIDEAHHAPAESYVRLWRRYPAAKKLGMTATPCRMNRRGFADLFGELVSAAPMLDFVREGYLARYDFVSISPDSRAQRLVDGLQRRGADGDYQLKELGEVFNHRRQVEQLYATLCEYAPGRKGIVYAINIAHARRIAECYSRHGLRAAAIDSRTPAEMRREDVARFRAGELDVLVNVDVFSEGFDCPDVEFVQMARPTLSLAKYLQQVGRGLRMSPGKEACVLIDNVGLYRTFGLPTDVRDWDAMFRGVQTGRGLTASLRPASRSAESAARTGLCHIMERREEPVPQMIIVMDRDRLLAADDATTAAPRPVRLTERGAWGLMTGDRLVYPYTLRRVLEVCYGYAVAERADRRLTVIARDGRERLLPPTARRVTIDRRRVARVTGRGVEPFYIDLVGGHRYEHNPACFTTTAGVELLLLDRVLYSRTRCRYRAPMEEIRRVDRERYTLMADRRRPETEAAHGDCVYAEGGRYGIVLLPGDEATYYLLAAAPTAAGTVIVSAADAAPYHLTPAGECRPLTGDVASAVRRLRALDAPPETVEERIEPFSVAGRWGLKRGGRIVCAPCYAAVSPPVGRYCAFRNGARAWGVLGPDGRECLPARYAAVVLHPEGTADVSLTAGLTKRVKLGE